MTLRKICHFILWCAAMILAVFACIPWFPVSCIITIYSHFDRWRPSEYPSWMMPYAPMTYMDFLIRGIAK
jgi:hypothetical protein